MSTHADATFTVKTWDEKPYNEAEELPKLTHAKMAYVYQGGLEGESTVASLMVYGADGSASFVGLERFSGKLGGKSGSFVSQSSGTFDAAKGLAKGTWFVVPGSGTGELKNLKGQGSYSATHQPPGKVGIDYDFE